MAEARFCSQCGAKFQAGASFCVECGLPVPGARGAGGRPLPLARYAPVIVIGVLLLVVGVVVTIGMLNPKTPPSVPGKPGGGAPSGVSGKMPEGHPPIGIPDEVKQNIRNMAKAAEAQPDNVPVWQQLAEVQYRAGELDPTYLAAAQLTFEHVLEREPNNADVLRSLGNIAFDREQPEKAIEYYTRYLVLKPDDKNVGTDLATMRLAAGKIDEAIAAYQKILAADPAFFQAEFNLGLAYQRAGQQTEAVVALQKARELATDDGARQQVEQVLSRVQRAGAAPAASAPSAAADTLRGGLEAFFRANQIIGPKLDRFEWSDDTHVRVVLHEFPISSMPEDVRQRFAEHIRSQIREQKTAHQVTQPVAVQLADDTSGEVMETISE